MKLISVRLITDDVRRLTQFYETVTAARATFSTDDFAELVGETATLAIGSTRTVPTFAPGSAEPAANRSAIVEFLVTDVDAEWHRLRPLVDPADVVLAPTTMPWGNRALLLRDPDGSLVNLFTPWTAQARAKFGLA